MLVGITGAAGYIGSRVMRDAIKKGHEVVGIDNFYLGQVEEVLENKIVNADIRNLKKTESLLGQCDSIIHLAALSGVDDCNKKPDLAFKTNVIGTQNIAWICYKHKIPLIFVSSMAIFGNPKRFPIREEDPKIPLNFYGLTKLLGMKNIEYLSRDNFPAFVFILGNVYGNHLIGEKTITKQTVVNIFVNQARTGKTLTVYGPGTQARDFIHVKDVSKIFLRLIERIPLEPGCSVFNLSSGRSYSVMDIARLVRKESGLDLKIKVVSNPREDETLVESFDINTEKIRKEMDLSTNIDIGSEIRNMLESGF